MSSSIEGLQVEVRGTGPVAVLVHGTAPPVWGDLVDLLATDCTVVSYARRSFPPSDPGHASSLRAHADDLGAVIDMHGGHAVVVGWSIGGVIALDLAAREPRLVDALVLLEAALHLKRRPTPAMVRAVVTAQRVGRRSGPEGGRRFLAWALRRADGPNDLHRFDRHLLDLCGPAIVAELALGTGEHELRRLDLSSITTPARWLVGSQSRTTFASSARRAAASMPGLVLEQVPGAGHAIHLDDPGAVAMAVRRALFGHRQ